MPEDTNPSGSAAPADPIAMISDILERDPASTGPDAAPEPTPDPKDISLVDDDEDDAPEAPDDAEPSLDGGDDADDDDIPEPTEPEARKFTVKVDGQTLEVTEQELIKGYQLEASYRKKTAEVAEQRRQIEAEAQRVSDERAYYAQQLQQIAQSIQVPQEPDARLATTDPIGYVQARAAWEQQMRQYQYVTAEQQRLAQQQQAEHRQYFERHLAAEQEKLVEALPEWRDGRKAQAEKRSLTEYLRKAGYTDEEIGAATDHRAIVLARKAALYDKIVANRPTVEQRIAQAPKTLKPGSTAPGDSLAAQRKAQWKQLQRTGGVDAAAALIALG